MGHMIFLLIYHHPKVTNITVTVTIIPGKWAIYNRVRLPDGHLIRIPHGAVKRRRPSQRCTQLYYKVFLRFHEDFDSERFLKTV